MPNKNKNRKNGNKPVRKSPNPANMWLRPSSINRVTTMMLQGESALTSAITTGVLNQFIPFDPSSAGYGFNEWASLSALYNEVKHVATEIQLVPYQYTGAGSPLYVSYRFDSASAPGTVSAVVGSATLRLYNITRDTSSLGLRMIARARKPLNWSPTSTVVTNAYAGAPGCFQFYGSGYDPTSAQSLCLVRVRGIYAFRGRS